MSKKFILAWEAPAILQPPVQQAWENYQRACEAAATTPILGPEAQRVLARVWAGSDFVARQCARRPALLSDLFSTGDLLRAYAQGELQRKVARAVSSAKDTAQLQAHLIEIRQREMVRLAWRDLAGWAPLEETLAELTALAEGCTQAALGKLQPWLEESEGRPLGDLSQTPQSLVVIGMGKLGGEELNFSSDIDLIFAYPEEGRAHGRRNLSNEEFFVQLGQRLINVLSGVGQDFIYRVDMRLRPFGEAGPLAGSFDALEDYYQAHGREWERYAWIKARPLTGSAEIRQALQQRIQPFIYRRYLDFGTFAALREMKGMIAQEVARKGLADNIKLGPGGIREIEFIGQAFQLIRGGREPALQSRQILRTLDQLAQRGHLPHYASHDLQEAYVFLRRAENRLQELADQQTHSLPVEPIPRAQLAVAMNYADWESFSHALDQHTKRVQEYFDQVFVAPQTHDHSPASGAPDLTALWRGSLTEAQAHSVLTTAGFDDVAEAARLCARLREGHTYRALSNQGRTRMDRLMPLLLGAISATPHPTTTLLRLIQILEAIARRTAYLALLAENPLALSQLVKLCAASPWITRLLARQPVLLDELLDPRTLYAPLNRRALERDLADRLNAIATEDTDADLEQQMEVLRQFKQAAVLHVAAADVAGTMPLMVVSDHLTDIAEVVLAQALWLAWDHLTARHGVPQYTLDGVTHNAGFAIIGYGKLGGIELGYGSDLDLVFLHDSEGEQQQSSGQQSRGQKSIDNAVFFARLGQRIIHILSTQTPSGTLYEVDMRLRPSGTSGLLVSNLAAYADYQRHEAWTWEHQALVRARVVAGSAVCATIFNELRHEILARRRDPEILRGEVREMRERMRAELAPQPGNAPHYQTGYFDLKQQQGGIADIEFMVQYGVLAWTCDHPALADFTDNIRQLQGFAAAGLMPEHDVQQLSHAYRAYRAALHRLTLQEEPAQVSDTEFRDERAVVTNLWHTVMNA